MPRCATSVVGGILGYAIGALLYDSIGLAESFYGRLRGKVGHYTPVTPAGA